MPGSIQSLGSVETGTWRENAEFPTKLILRSLPVNPNTLIPVNSKRMNFVLNSMFSLQVPVSTEPRLWIKPGISHSFILVCTDDFARKNAKINFLCVPEVHGALILVPRRLGQTPQFGNRWPKQVNIWHFSSQIMHRCASFYFCSNFEPSFPIYWKGWG